MGRHSLLVTIAVLGTVLGCDRSPKGSDAIGQQCMSVADAKDRAKPSRSADAPFADCAAGVFGHCPPKDTYCSVPFNAEATRQERLKTPSVCCYGR